MDDEIQNEISEVQNTNSESILTSIKKLLGIHADCKDFDSDLIMHINSVFMVLNQLGVESEKVFSIEDEKAVWSDFTERKDFKSIKTYIYLKVKMVFDPPLSAAVQTSIKESINEFEWRLNVQAESNKEEV